MKRFKFEVQNELKALPISERTIIIQKYKKSKGWEEIAKQICYSERTMQEAAQGSYAYISCKI